MWNSGSFCLSLINLCVFSKHKTIHMKSAIVHIQSHTHHFIKDIEPEVYSMQVLATTLSIDEHLKTSFWLNSVLFWQYFNLTAFTNNTFSHKKSSKSFCKSINDSVHKHSINIKTYYIVFRGHVYISSINSVPKTSISVFWRLNNSNILNSYSHVVYYFIVKQSSPVWQIKHCILQ